MKGWVGELIAHQAADRPAAVAVASGARTLTYGELAARAEALAHRLLDLGVGPDVVVGLCLGRSPAMIVAALATLQAGGAYLPLDPSDPAARLSFMLTEAKVSVLIAAHCAKDTAPTGDYALITIDDTGTIVEAAASKGARAPAVALSPEHLAYVIYTSGSTGRPKGVEVVHAGLQNLIEWHQRAFRVTAADRASQVAKVGFDAAVWEVWPYLAAGAGVHVAEERTVNDAPLLRDWLVAQGITIAFVPTPMAERLLALPWPAATALRIMLTGADTLHKYPPADLPFQFVNNYGPTECTVVATSGLVPPNGTHGRLPAIGSPIAGVQVHILDESRKPVHRGAAGEIYIGGAGVARGYRHRPDLTAERFVASPLNGNPSERLFRTGDLGRYLADGQIAFLGRIDEQVKVRGHRVEPTEVVAALDRSPDIQQSCVVASQTDPSDVRLIAYVVAAPDAELTARGLRDWLSASLPDYMIPANFVRVDWLPLTPNGKVDRQALPPPNETNVLQDPVITAPRTETEQAVASLLGQLLRLASVDVEENFFALGGHSLLGAQLLARVREAFGVEVPLRQLFEGPTVAELAAAIERLRAANSSATPAAAPAELVTRAESRLGGRVT